MDKKRRGILSIFGIDIGGRHIGMALVEENGKIIEKEIVNYKEDKTEKFILEKINSYVSLYEGKVSAIGIGVPGIIKDNKIVYTCNLSLKDSYFVKKIHTRAPVYLANDALCATLAEYQLVDGCKYDNYALMTVGTGIGAGLIFHKQIYEGRNGYAGEIGHTVIKKNGIACNCGRRGCFEKYASVTKLLQSAKVDTLREFFYLAERNRYIAGIFDEYLEDLAEGIANFIMISDIDMLVIGGSLAWFGDKFYYILRAKIAQRLFNRDTQDVKMKFAKLGNDAGLIGAALLPNWLT